MMLTRVAAATLVALTTGTVLVVAITACHSLRSGTSCEENLRCPKPDAGAAGEAGANGFGGLGGSTGATGIGGSNGGSGNSASGGGQTSSNGDTASSMGSAAASGGGTGGNLPCDGACTGDTLICNEDTDTCVECLGTNDCEEGVCNTQANECVGCLETSDCEEGVCDTDANLCVECLETSDCDEPSPLCDAEQQFCVECLESTHCTETTASYCDAGSCAPCESNVDCEHLPGTTVCDADAGQCVECTIAEEAVCGGTSCNPATKTCTETEVGSTDDCQPCLADSECIGGNQMDPVRRCIPIEFADEPTEGGFCFRRRSMVEECERPFVLGITVGSLSGAAPELYCGIDETNTTCEAVLDLQRARTCPNGDDAECGCPRDEGGTCTAPGKGGLCRNFATVNNRCTYQCGGSDECPTSRECYTESTPDFCE